MEQNARLPIPSANSWYNQRVFIIGGGPSLPIDKISGLEGKGKIIAVNDAFKIAPWADLLTFADKIWYDWNREQVDALTMPVIGGYINNIVIPGVEHWPSISPHGLIGKNGHVVGDNAGHQALSLAIWFGAKEIVLLGFDLDIEVEQTHWHNFHKRQTFKSRYKTHMIPNFIETAKHFHTRNVNVWNTNPDSALPQEYFPYKALDIFL